MAECDGFDSLLYIEDRLQKQGYKDGYKHGKAEGMKEAMDAGRANGLDVGWEIGYYSGFADTWLHLLKHKSNLDRMIRALTALNERIRSFQVLNVTSDDYAKEFSQIQAKYRQILALLKAPVVVKNKNDLSF